MSNYICATDAMLDSLCYIRNAINSISFAKNSSILHKDKIDFNNEVILTLSSIIDNIEEEYNL